MLTATGESDGDGNLSLSRCFFLIGFVRAATVRCGRDRRVLRAAFSARPGTAGLGFGAAFGGARCTAFTLSLRASAGAFCPRGNGRRCRALVVRSVRHIRAAHAGRVDIQVDRLSIRRRSRGYFRAAAGIDDPRHRSPVGGDVLNRRLHRAIAEHNADSDQCANRDQAKQSFVHNDLIRGKTFEAFNDPMLKGCSDYPCCRPHNARFQETVQQDCFHVVTFPGMRSKRFRQNQRIKRLAISGMCIVRQMKPPRRGASVGSAFSRGGWKLDDRTRALWSIRRSQRSGNRSA